MPARPHSDCFTGALPGPLREKALAQAQLEDQLGAMLAAARSAFPGVQLAAETFLEYLAARVGSEGELSALDGLAASDLYLACACACARGDAAAMAALEASCF